MCPESGGNPVHTAEKLASGTVYVYSLRQVAGTPGVGFRGAAGQSRPGVRRDRSDAQFLPVESETDCEILAAYVQKLGKIPDEYKDPKGQGRMKIK